MSQPGDSLLRIVEAAEENDEYEKRRRTSDPDPFNNRRKSSSTQQKLKENQQQQVRIQGGRRNSKSAGPFVSPPQQFPSSMDTAAPTSQHLQENLYLLGDEGIGGMGPSPGAMARVGTGSSSEEQRRAARPPQASGAGGETTSDGRPALNPAMLSSAHAVLGSPREVPLPAHGTGMTPTMPRVGAISEVASRPALSSQQVVGQWLRQLEEGRNRPCSDSDYSSSEDDEEEDDAELSGADGGNNKANQEAKETVRRKRKEGGIAIGNQGFKTVAHDLNLDTNELLDCLYHSSKEFEAHREAVESGEYGEFANTRQSGYSRQSPTSPNGDSNNILSEALIEGSRDPGREPLLPGHESPPPQAGVGNLNYLHAGGRRLSARMETVTASYSKAGPRKTTTAAWTAVFPSAPVDSETLDPSVSCDSGICGDSRVIVFDPATGEQEGNLRSASTGTPGVAESIEGWANSSVARSSHVHSTRASGRADTPNTVGTQPRNIHLATKPKGVQFKRNVVKDVVLYEVDNAVFIDIQYQRNKLGWFVVLIAVLFDVTGAVVVVRTILVSRASLDKNKQLSYFTLAFWSACWSIPIYFIFAAIMWASNLVSLRQVKKGFKLPKVIGAATAYGVAFAGVVLIQLMTAEWERHLFLPPSYLPTMNFDLFFLLGFRKLRKEATFFQEWLGATVIFVGYSVAAFPMLGAFAERGWVAVLSLNGGLLALSGVETAWFAAVSHCNTQGKSLVVTLLPAVMVQLLMYFVAAVVDLTTHNLSLAPLGQMFDEENVGVGALVSFLLLGSQIFYMAAARYLDVISLASGVAVKAAIMPYLVHHFVYEDLPPLYRYFWDCGYKTECKNKSGDIHYPGWGPVLFIGTTIVFLAAIFMVVFSSVKRQFVARRIAFSPSRLKKAGNPHSIKAQRRAERQARRDEAQRAIAAATAAAGPNDGAEGSGGVPSTFGEDSPVREDDRESREE